MGAGTKMKPRGTGMPKGSLKSREGPSRPYRITTTQRQDKPTPIRTWEQILARVGCRENHLRARSIPNGKIPMRHRGDRAFNQETWVAVIGEILEAGPQGDSLDSTRP